MNFQIGLQTHKKLFPKATEYSQILQLDEELRELSEAYTTENIKEEIGDVLVVAVSLRRFKRTQNISKFILDKMYFDKPIKEQKKLMKYFEKALNKCAKRISEERYYYLNGLYLRDKNFYKSVK